MLQKGLNDRVLRTHAQRLFKVFNVYNKEIEKCFVIQLNINGEWSVMINEKVVQADKLTFLHSRFLQSVKVLSNVEKKNPPQFLKIYMVNDSIFSCRESVCNFLHVLRYLRGNILSFRDRYINGTYFS